MAVQGRLFAVLAASGLAACIPVSFDGRWLGVCETPDLGMRIDVVVMGTESDDEEDWASATVHRPDRRGSALSLTCGTVEQSFWDVEVSRCRGDWDGADAPHDLALSGEMDPRDTGPVLEGDCTIDGLDGDLELWRLP